MFAVNTATGDLYDCVSASWVKVGGAGGGAPASPSGSVQYNNSGSFGAVPYIKAGTANCDGMADPCAFTFNPGASFGYVVYGTDSTAPMGNSFDLFYSGGWELDASDGTNTGSLIVGYDTGGTSLTMGGSLGDSGLKIESSNRLLAIGRFQFSTNYVTGSTSSNFTAGAGWGNAANFTPSGGSDNLFVFFVTAGGASIAANPTFTYSYADGDFTTGASTVLYICQQTGGNDIIADVTTTTRNQTNEVFTWHGTPTTGKTYEITCFGSSTN
jgi:hypothetical protein